MTNTILAIGLAWTSVAVIILAAANILVQLAVRKNSESIRHLAETARLHQEVLRRLSE